MAARFQILMFALLLACGMVQAQGRADSHVREGDRLYSQLAYALAVHEYQAASELGAITEHVSRCLADCHMKLGNTADAERWYSTVVKFLNREPRDLYNYAQALKSNGRYLEAEEWMDRYLAMVDPDNAPHRSNVSGFARKFTEGEPRFSVRPVSINTQYSDFGTAWLGRDRVLFSTARSETIGIERRAAWNDQPFLDIYTAELTPGGDLVNAGPLAGSVNSKYHEGPATVSASADVIWFTRNNYHKGMVQRSSKGISRLGIFKARAESEGYGNVEQFLYNNSEVSMGHPALSPDGGRLYFVSDMPGGYGGTDIYVCRMQDGQWSEPRNLGPAVNTAGNESFPFMAQDGTLYFASNGHPGLGGLDIFAAMPAADGGFAPALNVGAPVNGPRDDFAFIIDAAGQRGFFSSNRPDGRGSDDIYAFTMLAPLEQRFLCTGLVIDDELEIPVMAAEVRLYQLDGTLLATTWTDARGEYAFPVEKDRAYRLEAKLRGRFDGEQHLTTERIEQEQIITRDIHLVADAGIWMRGAVHRKDRLGAIAGMVVSVVNLSSYYSESQITGEGGDFNMRLQSNEEFEVLFEKPGFFNMSMPVSTMGMKEGIIFLDQIRDLAFEPLVVAVPIPLKFMRWAQGGSTLEPLARTELDGLAERLLVNPALLVEIAVHSDARGDAAVEQRLTQKRADAVVEYLRSKGVPGERLTAKGYGSSRILNACEAGVPCSEEEHAVNRRTEYVVTGIMP